MSLLTAFAIAGVFVFFAQLLTGDETWLAHIVRLLENANK